MQFRTVLLSLFLFTGASSSCQIIQPNQNYSNVNQFLTNTDDIEIDGIVVDNTQTKIGKDFYELFYQLWNQSEKLPKQSITVSEKVLPQLGSQISIQVEDYVIFQQNIQPQYEIIEQMAGYALQQAIIYIENYDEMQKQLMGEDIEGTGIY